MFLPFRLSPFRQVDRLPLSLYSVGLHAQPYQSRATGYPTMQCFIVFEGKGRFKLRDGTHVTVEGNQVLLMPKGHAHEYYSLLDTPWIVGYIGIGGKIVEEIIEAYGLPCSSAVSVKPAGMNILHDKLTEIWKLADNSSFNQTAQLSVSIYELLLQLSELTTTVNVPDLTAARISDEALQRAVQYLHEHYNENLLMSNVAHAVGYSVQHFQRIFKQSYGVSPHAYLQRIRLHQAAAWLEEDRNHSIIDIASRLGMEPNYLIRIFKKEYGVSPGAFRDALHAERKERSAT